MTIQSPTMALPAPTEDEKTMAMLAYVLAIFSGFIAPLVIYLVKRQSRFVAFHALQILIWHALFFVLMMIGMMVLFATMFATMPAHSHPAPGEPAEGPPWAFFGLFGSVWLFGMGSMVLNLVIGIVYAIKSNQGEWIRLPIVGNLLLRNALPVASNSQSS